MVTPFSHFFPLWISHLFSPDLNNSKKYRTAVLFHHRCLTNRDQQPATEVIKQTASISKHPLVTRPPLLFGKRTLVTMRTYLVVGLFFALVSAISARIDLHLDPPISNRAESDEDAQCVTQEGRQGRCTLKGSCNAPGVDNLPVCYTILPFLQSVCCPYNPAPGNDFQNIPGQYARTRPIM